MTATLADLKAKNLAVVNSETALTNARIARDASMYNDNTGMVDISVDVKTYVKSIYGATSPQYKQISKLKFTKRKKKLLFACVIYVITMVKDVGSIRIYEIAFGIYVSAFGKFETSSGKVETSSGKNETSTE